MAKIAAGEIWQSTIAVMRPRLGELVAVVAPFTLLVEMALTLFGPTPPTTLAEYTPRHVLLLILLPGLVGAIAQLTVSRLVALPDEPPRVALAAAFALFPVYVGALLLSGAPMALGFMLFIIPGLYLAARLFVVAPIVAVERLGPVAAVQRSWVMTAGHGWQILIFIALLLLVVIGTSVLAGGVGRAFGSVLALVGLKPVGSFVVALVGAAVAMLTSIGSAIAATEIYLKLR